MVGRVLHTALFLMGLLGTAYGIGRMDRLPFWSWGRDRMGTAAAALATVDTVFFGSSRISYGVIPAEFDARARELGTPTNSFNAGLSGTWPHEFDQVCRWLLDQPHPKLRRAIIELHSWDKPCEGNWMADQEVELHDIGNLLDRLATVWAGKTNYAERVWRTYHHSMHSLANFFRIGQGPRILDDLVATLRTGSPVFGHVGDQGFVCVETIQLDYFRKRRAEFVDDAKRHDGTLAWKAKEPTPESLRGGFRLDAWRALDRRLRDAGVEPIYVVMPSFSIDFQGRDILPLLAQQAKVVEFDLPQANPGLFDHAYWFDTTHMNRVGATKFSRLLADAVLGSGGKTSGAAAAPAVLRGTAAWVPGDAAAIDLRVVGAPEGEVIAVVSVATDDRDLGNGVRARVGLPGLANVLLSRDGENALGRLEGPIVPIDRALYVQYAVMRDGVWVAVSDRVDLPARH